MQASNGTVYPKTVTVSGNSVQLTVTDSDTAYSGGGSLQMTFTDSGEIIKTVIANTNVLKSLNATDPAPDPIETWLDQASETLNKVDGMTASASVAADATPTATISTVGGHYNIAFGIPAATAVVEVSGTTPAITAAANTAYICGTVASISITPPASGVCDVMFTSGTTPAVLTVPNTVVFPSWFDPTSLQASTVYEINILNNYGVVTIWD